MTAPTKPGKEMTSDEFEKSTAPLKVVKTLVAREQGPTKPDAEELITRLALAWAPIDDDLLLDDAAAALRAQQEKIERLTNTGTYAWLAGRAANQEKRAESAEAERDALRQDAERYRWLGNNLSNNGDGWEVSCWHAIGKLRLWNTKQTMDERIDAARAKEQKC